MGREGSTNLTRHFTKNADVQNGRRIILNSIPIIIIKDLKCSINKNIVLLYERHKSSPKPNTIIITNVTAVTSAKHSDSDTEPASFVRLSYLYITWTIKTSQAAQYCMQLLNKLHSTACSYWTSCTVLHAVTEQAAQYCMQLLNKLHRCSVRAVLTVGILRKISG